MTHPETVSPIHVGAESRLRAENSALWRLVRMLHASRRDPSLAPAAQQLLDKAILQPTEFARGQA